MRESVCDPTAILGSARKNCGMPSERTQHTMPEFNTIEDLLAHSIQDLYSAETQLLDALPKMAGAAADPALADAFTAHLEQTKGHVLRLENEADLLGVIPQGLTCKAMKGLIAEGEETIQEDMAPAIKDLGLIGAAQRVEHYEIAAYCAAKALAEAVANQQVVALLQETIEEEIATEKGLTGLALKVVGSAPSAADDLAV